MRSRSPVARALLAAAVVAVAVLSGCAGLQQPEVERSATAFATGDPATRCSLLASATLAALTADEPGTCGTTVGELAPAGGHVVSTKVWGDAAQVRLTDDTQFLTRTSAGWRVTAAGCTPNGDAPYRCRVEGP